MVPGPGFAAITLAVVGAVLLATFYIVVFTTGDTPCNDTDGEATCKPPEAPMVLFYGGLAFVLAGGVLALVHFRLRRAADPDAR